MNRLFVIIIYSLVFTIVHADDNPYIINQSSFFRVMPIYQHWSVSDNSTISEMSTPFFAYLPVNRQIGITLRGSQASVNGDLPGLNGVTDTQLSMSYHLESMNLVFNVGLNLPSGKDELTVEEFQTSALLSLNQFNFTVPNFGQGLNVSPGISWALPLGDNFVVGLGASYQYKGKFKPIEDMIDLYTPGDEILFTSGFDIRLGPASSLSTDVIYTTYETDKIGGRPVFESGSRIVFSEQFYRYFGHNRLWLSGRYRSKSKNSYAVAGALLEEAEKTSPNQIEFLAHYTFRFNKIFSLGFMTNIRSFEKTSVFPGIDLVGFGIAPKLSFSQTISIPFQLKYNYGMYKNQDILSGYEGGLGLEIRL